MPGTWPDDDGIGDDDADDHAFDAPLTAPLHPDDRLWRHPSEMAWGVAPATAAVPAAGPKPAPRPWVIAVASGLTGAALALGMVALFAGIGTGTDRVTDRIGVRDQLPDPSLAADTEGAVAVARAVTPSIVRIEVGTDRGTTTGSGVVLRDDGHIVTNAHVLDGARTLTILLADGTAVAGRVVGADAFTDIAVVAPADDDADDLAWEPAVRGPAGELTVGEPALSVGSPLGSSAQAPSVTLGVISALGRQVRLRSGGVLHGMIQTNAPITGGASGGALCDQAGRVVGITTAAHADESPSHGFATPMETVWQVAESLIDDGVVHHVWLGIEGADIAPTQTSILGLIASVGGGVVVDRVVAGSPAEDADLQRGDVLVSVDGEPVSSMSDLVVTLRRYEPGDDVVIGVERDGDVDTATVTLGEREG